MSLQLYSSKRIPGPRSQSRRRLISWILIFLIWLPAFASMSGCSGCRQSFSQKQKTEEEERKEEELGEEKEKLKPDFEAMQASILPGSNPVDTDEETIDATEEQDDEQKSKLERENPNISRSQRPVTAKPGHWVHVRYRSQANNFDFKGELASQCVDRNMLPMDLEKSPFSVTSVRPAALPKEQSKDLEIPIFVTPPSSNNRRTIQIFSRLRTRASGREVIGDISPITRMKPHQYHMVVLSKDPDQYGFLRAAEAIKPPYDEWAMDGLQENYIVTMHTVEEGSLLPLPNNALAWSSIAYVIWDDLPPDALDVDQQSAMLDWLNWGGQLLISGPRSLDSLRSSFLADFLPAKTDKARPIAPEEFDEINDLWSLTPGGNGAFDAAQFRLGGKDQTIPLEITPLTPISPADFVADTANFVVERRTGRGRILATAFRLSERRFVNWQNYDGFLNGCLLRLPARSFYTGSSGFGAVRWRDPDLRLVNQDARLATQLRFFSRDFSAAVPTRRRRQRSQRPRTRTTQILDAQEQQEIARENRERRQQATEEARSAEGNRRATLWGFVGRNSKEVVYRLDGTQNDSTSGVGGWSDFSAAGQAARQSLLDAAGISIPNSGFVAKVLMGYLACLVPLNWLIFRVIRRVEWAWFAAPAIAILGAVGVVKMAQLDIGFVRSRTEVAILEMQPDYPRAHLTRYCGVYSSLTSDYAVTFEDDQAFALPFSTDPRPEQLNQMRRQSVAYRRDKNVGLSGYPVLSNSTGMLHIEQMIDVAGDVEFSNSKNDKMELTNGTEWDLQSAVALYRNEDGRFLFATIGQFPVGEKVTLQWQSIENGDAFFQFLDQSPTTAQAIAEGVVSLHELYRLGSNVAQFAPGDMRLLAWTDQEVTGMEIAPNATQQTFRTLIVKHLKYRKYDDPQVDENHFAEFRKDPDEDDEELE